MMNHLERMQAQAQKRLPKDESIIYCVPSDYRQTDGGDMQIPMGIMAATEKRIFYLSAGLIGFTMEDFPYENISRINLAKEDKGYSLSLAAWDSQAVLKWTMLGDISKLVSYAREKIVRQRTVEPMPEPFNWQPLKHAAFRSPWNDLQIEHHHLNRDILAKRQ